MAAVKFPTGNMHTFHPGNDMPSFCSAGADALKVALKQISLDFLKIFWFWWYDEMALFLEMIVVEGTEDVCLLTSRDGLTSMMHYSECQDLVWGWFWGAWAEALLLQMKLLGFDILQCQSAVSSISSPSASMSPPRCLTLWLDTIWYTYVFLQVLFQERH